MNDSKNFYLILIVSSVIVLVTKNLFPKNQKEHFIGPIVSPLNAIASFAANFPMLIGVLVDAFVNFAISFVDIFLSLLNVLSWIVNVPMWVINGAMFLFTAFMDIITLMILWLNPITMIKGIIKLIFFIVKLIITTLITTITGVTGAVLERVLNGVRGGLWGLPHGPEQHLTHDQGDYADRFKRSQYGLYGHHHGTGENGDKNFVPHLNPQDKIYQPMRCYRGIGANGYINVVAMIICPPLGVFMSYGLKGMLKIVICAGLTLLYYFPGLMYGLLVTTHLGIGRDIDTSDCGGGFGGLMTEGCPKRKNKTDCNAANIHNKQDSKGEPMKACIWKDNPNGKEGSGKCYNLHFRQEKYHKLHSGNLDKETIDDNDRFNYTGDTNNENFRYPLGSWEDDPPEGYF